MDKQDLTESKLKWLKDLNSAFKGLLGTIGICIAICVGKIMFEPEPLSIWFIHACELIGLFFAIGALFVMWRAADQGLIKQELDNKDYEKKLTFLNLDKGCLKIIKMLEEDRKGLGNDKIKELKKYLNLDDCDCSDHDDQVVEDLLVDGTEDQVVYPQDSTDHSV